MMANEYELLIARRNQETIWLFHLQVLFLTAMLVCMIAVVWFPGNWAQLAVNAVLLLFAGAACRKGRT